MLRFTLFGFPVRVEWMFWVIGCLLMFPLLQSSNPKALQFLILWLIVFFVSILWHEIGHALAMRKYGGRPEILLYGMGGVCSSTGQYTRQQSMFISAAGPAAGFLLALIALILLLSMGYRFTWKLEFSSRTEFALRIMFIINTFWTLMNLLPVLPLDGGQILRAFMSNRNSSLVPKIGTIVAGLVAVISLILTQRYFMPILFGYLAYQNWLMTKGHPNQRPF